MDWLALIVVPALWAKAVYASPNVATRRHGSSAALACLASLLLFASLRFGHQVFPVIFSGACIITTAMFVALLWQGKQQKGGVR